MSEDRVLLERAAKAAGIEVHGNVLRRDGTWGLYVGDGEIGCWDVWNPLLDDGDAFRLAVKLEIDMLTDDGDGLVGTIMPDGTPGPAEPTGNDQCAALRRCVVRAAAALGDHP